MNDKDFLEDLWDYIVKVYGYFLRFLKYSGCLIALIVFIVIIYITSSFLEQLATELLGEKIYTKISDFVRILIIGYIVYSYFNAQFQSLNVLFKRIEYLQKTVNSLKEIIIQLKDKNN